MKQLGGIVIVVLLVVVACSLVRPAPETPSQCAPSAPPSAISPDVERTLGALGVGKVPISYVAVVDVSAAVQEGDGYARMREDLRQSLAALGPADSVAVVTYGSVARTVVPISPRGTGELQLAALPPQPKGSAANIGLGLEQGVVELAGTPAGQPAAIVLFTGGPQKTAAGARFADTSGADWAALRDRAAEVGRGRPVTAYAVPLADRTGMELLCSVYPGATPLAVGTSTETLSAYLERLRTDARLRAAQLVVRRNNGQGVNAVWDVRPDLDIGAGTTDAVVHLHNTAPDVPVVIDGARVAAVGELAPVGSNLPEHVVLAPGQTLDFAVRLTWSDPGPTDAILGGGRRPYATTLSIEGTVSSPLAADVALLDGDQLTVAPGVRGAGLLAGTAAVGYDPSWAIVVGVLAALGVAVIWRRFPAMTGEIVLARRGPDVYVDDGDRRIRPPLSVATRRIAVHRLLTGRRRCHTWSVVIGNDPTQVRVTVRGRRRVLGRGPAEPWLDVRVQLPGQNRSARRRLPVSGTRMILGIEIRHMPYGPIDRGYVANPPPATTPLEHEAPAEQERYTARQR